VSVPQPVPGSGRARTLATAAALVVIVALGSLTAVAVHVTQHRSSGGSADRTTLLAVGGQLAVDFTSFDYRHLDADFAATARRATPAFAKTYLTQSRSVASVITKAKAVSTSQVVATGLKSASATNAVVLVAINDLTKNTSSPKGTTQYFRMQISLVRQNGQWLASQVEPL
jgi:Mce-associated membrane protein